MSDAAWALLEPLLPDRTPRRGGRWADHRQVVDAIRWRVRTGCPWRDLPGEFGPWQTIYGRHRRWCADGTWTQVLDGLRAGADHDEAALDAAGGWVLSVDSTVVRAHFDAAGARHDPPQDVPSELLEELAAAVPAGTRNRSTGRSANQRSGQPPAEPASQSAQPSSSPAPEAGGGVSGGADRPVRR